MARITRHGPTVAFDPKKNQVLLIDQRLLPHRFEVFRSEDYRTTARAIRDMVVRGAGAIAATAAYGLVQGIQAYRGRSLQGLFRHIDRVFQTLREARPTAVDPVNAMVRIRNRIQTCQSVEEVRQRALEEADRFAREQVEEARAIGRHGATLIRDGMRILTHCNAGRLGFVDIGSALAPIYEAWRQGKQFTVFVDETRPRSQGAKLTAWELAQAGIPHFVIADNAAGYFMARGEIDLVIVGADRVVGRTGDIANKIGTYTKAVLAARHKIPFYVAIPLSTLDWELESGMQIPIEERSPDEVLYAWGTTQRKTFERVRVANPTSPARNPAFDVTPAELISGIITCHGIFRPTDLWSHRSTLQSGFSS